MNTIIGLLLIVTLFSAHYARIDSVSYELDKAHRAIVKALKKLDEKDEVSVEKVDCLFENVEKNSRMIKKLLVEKENLRGSVKAVMNVFVFSNKRMSEEQMEGYRVFEERTREKNEELKEILEKLHNKENVNKISSELMKDKSDLKKIYSDLKEINEYQAEAIKSLNLIIDDTRVVMSCL
ncbi:MAG: hypothetical protein IJ736_00710 [Firmicutes bacterium]|nr:hypothetical protein [Bacillota bacterium]